MPREVPALLLLLASFVLCAGFVAPSASQAAPRFVAQAGTTLEATRAGPDVFTAGGIGKECRGVEFRVAALDRSRALELAPNYSECTTRSLGGIPTKMVWWDCGYVLHPFGAADHGGAWKARVDFTCPYKHVIEWNVYESMATYNIGKTLCVTRMPLQRAGGVAELRNTHGSPGAIEVTWKLSGIEYEAFGSSLFCGVLPETPKSDASYAGHAVIGAVDATGQHRDFELRG